MGPLVYNEKYGFAVLDPATAIAAEDVWLSVDEVKEVYSKQ